MPREQGELKEISNLRVQRRGEERKGNQNQTKIGMRETELGRSDESSLGHIGQEMRASADTKMNPRDFFISRGHRKVRS